jgi:hypothetical protein
MSSEPTHRDWKRIVLAEVLAQHPARLTVQEIVRALVDPKPPRGEADNIEQAVTDLVGAGVLRLECESIAATRPITQVAEWLFA